MKTTVFVTILVLLLVAAAPQRAGAAGQADELTLKGGRSVRGLIVAEDPSSVTLRSQSGTKRYRKDRIVMILRGSAPAVADQMSSARQLRQAPAPAPSPTPLRATLDLPLGPALGHGATLSAGARVLIPFNAEPTATPDPGKP